MDSPQIDLNPCGFLVSLWEWGKKWNLQLVQNDISRMSRRAKSSLWILHEYSLLMCDDYCRSRPAGCVQMEAGIAEEHHVLNTVKTVPASISVHQLVLGTEGVFCGSCSLISDQTVLCGNDPSGARPLKCLFFTQLFNKVLEVSQ